MHPQSLCGAINAPGWAAARARYLCTVVSDPPTAVVAATSDTRFSLIVFNVAATGGGAAAQLLRAVPGPNQAVPLIATADAGRVPPWALDVYDGLLLKPFAKEEVLDLAATYTAETDT
jgi:hypothetical protein